ncbi:hypothetical protein DICPUDRAFT_48018 [Dictyostelium purpureum]|uniref:AMP-dependent synthetase/ligase domain-containing protein n=1 Tax=Dictyostelium purpureum TaxID=5786 RepID=F0ZMF7_DICPU|nr:uncharacterized protein DICPUDRAFT_48018 [Dictyostelium purpureum]EGC34859.1 hypothetical protein DICPUDRAFT_48018 [Dictyostelium purpureum]|eukprot:XP_003288613.1 hypothetical protein DICPUDRAFT_48018 [Dictyostelium purpureum]
MNYKTTYKLSEPYNYLSDLEFSTNDQESFWDQVAKKYVYWDKPYDQIFNFNEKTKACEWFKGGKLNTCYNILDRNIKERENDIAFVQEIPQKNLRYQITYREFYDQVLIFSRALKNIGIKKGDVVMIYMHDSIQVPIVMLSCARIGATHNVCYNGFFVDSLVQSIEDSKPKLIVTSNYGYVYNSIHYNSLTIKESISKSSHKPENVIVYNRKDFECDQPEKYLEISNCNFLDWDQLIKDLEPLQEYEPLDSLHPIFFLFTSGTTNKPKGILRETASQLVSSNYFIRNQVGLQQGETWYSKAPLGWASGHTWTVYGNLAVGSRSVIIEGSFNSDTQVEDYWGSIERNKANRVLITPSTIRVLIKTDPNGDIASKFDLSSLKKVTITSERSHQILIDYLENKVVKRPIVNNEYGQTEAGMINIGYSPSQYPSRTDSIGKPNPGGHYFRVVSKCKKTNLITELKANQIGELVLKFPLPPGYVASLVGDDSDGSLYKKQFLSEYEGYFDSGDMGYYDEDGYFYYVSRSGDTISVGALLINCSTIENEILRHPKVSDCCVVGVSDDILLQVPIALLVLHEQFCYETDSKETEELFNQLNQSIENVFSIRLQLKSIIIVKQLPKNKTNKKLKSLVKSIFNGLEFTIPPLIEDVSVINELVEEYNKYKKNNSNSSTIYKKRLNF